MPSMMRLVIVVAAVSGTCLAVAPSIRSRTVDAVLLKDGTRLLGVILAVSGGESRTTSILLRTVWLNDTAPGLISQIPEVPVQQPKAVGLLEDYIRELESTPDPPFDRIGFLRTRLVEVRAIEAEQQPVNFVILEVPERHIRRVYRQPPRFRNLGFLGLLNQLPQVEELTRKDAGRLLREIPPAKLATMLPHNNTLDSDTLFEHVRLTTDLEFGPVCRLIRLGEAFMDADSDDKPVALAARILAQQLNRQLADLAGENHRKFLPEKRWTTLPSAALALASERNATIVKITESDISLPTGTAKVTVSLFHRDRQQIQQFRYIGSVTGTAAAADVPAARSQNIAGDPRVQQVLELFGGLGSGNADISRALTMGAVVEIAQQRAETSLQELVPPVYALAERPKVITIPVEDLPPPEE